MLSALLQIIVLLIYFYTYIVIAACIASMLFGFGVLDPRNRVLYDIAMVLNRLTEPVLAPLRRVLPVVGNLDLSPLVLLLILNYLAVPAVKTIFAALSGFR